jgi:hypothetical protein
MCTSICSTHFTYSSMFENCFICMIIYIYNFLQITKHTGSLNSVAFIKSHQNSEGEFVTEQSIIQTDKVQGLTYIIKTSEFDLNISSFNQMKPATRN